MKPHVRDFKVQTVGGKGSAAFAISQSNATHIMGILRDTLYTDKILAVLREYGSNAWDAHRASGIDDKPIHVTLPTAMAPTLSIRDYGKGLSEKEVFEVYTQYGESSSRASNSGVGMLGIGSKSGFAYSDSFTIISWNEGTKSIYAAVLDEAGAGRIDKLHEQVCDLGDQGLEVQIPTKPSDRHLFYSKARSLFKFFSPRPQINTNLDEYKKPADATKAGWLNRQGGGWLAVMGCIPYKLNLNQVTDLLVEKGMSRAFQNLHGVLLFDIGDVEFAASREELKYSDITKKAIVDKLKMLVDSYVNQSIAKLGVAGISAWQKRLTAGSDIRQLGLALPPSYSLWAETTIKLTNFKSSHELLRKEPESFKLMSAGEKSHETTGIRVDKDAALLIKDTKRSAKGYSFHFSERIIAIKYGFTIDQVRKELDARLAVLEMSGMPIILMSTMDWSVEKGTRDETLKKKHKLRSFVLKRSVHDSGYNAPTYRLTSKSWDVVDRITQPDDVFVIIERFRTEIDKQNLGRLLWRDRVFFAKFDAKFKMPTIYGYKQTKSKPVDADKTDGITYQQWRANKIKSLFSKKHEAYVTALQWPKVLEGEYWHNSKVLSAKGGKPMLNIMIDMLGKDHAIPAMFKSYVKAKAVINNAAPALIKEINLLSGRGLLDGDSSNKKVLMRKAAVEKPYKLMQGKQWGLIWADRRAAWVEYIQLIDTSNKATANQKPKQETSNEPQDSVKL